MKILCNSMLLSNKIGVAQRAVNSKTTMEALKSLVLEASDGVLSIKGYNLESGIIARIDGVQVDEAGKIAVESKILGDIMRKMPNEVLSLEFKDGKLVIKTESSKGKGALQFNIVANGAEECPAIPDVNENIKINIKANILKDMVNKTRIAISQDQTKPALTGALLEIKDNIMFLVSLDGYRLAVSKNVLEENIPDSEVVIPGKVLNDIYTLLGSDEEDVEIGFDDNFISFTYGDIKIVSKLLSGGFPEHRKLTSMADCTTKLETNKKEFLQVIERATILSSSTQNNVVKLAITDNYTKIVATSDKGDLSEVVASSKTGNNLNIAFNAKYLIDIAKVITAEKVEFNFTNNVGPCIIKPIDGEDFTYLLLPVRISNIND